MKFSFLLFPLLLAACASPRHRVAADPELFASFPPGVQEAVRAGEVEPGFTPDMVKMALGDPHRVYTRATPDTETTVWQYLRIHRDVSTRPLFVTGSSHSFGSAWIDMEDTREIPLVRVEFVDGVVRAVETLHP